jgi:excisionase family DNA binding protein
MLYTTKEAAGMLKVDDSQVRRLCRSGEIRAHKIGSEWRIPERTLRRLDALPAKGECR